MESVLVTLILLRKSALKKTAKNTDDYMCKTVRSAFNMAAEVDGGVPAAGS